jgi:hypothetical protein
MHLDDSERWDNDIMDQRALILLSLLLIPARLTLGNECMGVFGVFI